MVDSKTIVYELIDLQPSTFILEGTENSGSPVHLTSPSLCRIPNTSSRMKIVKGKPTWERIRYIKGAPTLVESDQRAQGWEPNRASGADDIYFVAGKLLIIPGLDPLLEEFLEDSNNNVTNENRKSDATPLFKQLTQDEEVKLSIDDFFTTTRVSDYIRTLAMSNASGGLTLDEEKIDSVCSLLGLSGYDKYTEKLNAIIVRSQSDPESFLRKVSDHNAEKTALLRQAIEFGVVQWDGKDLKMSDGGKIVTSVKSEKDEKKIDEAVQYLLSGAGTSDSYQIEIAVKFKRDQRMQLS